MGRRTIVCVILGLAACAGDQPTEPIYEAEAFMAAPPPAPAPPTVLTGELSGGTGLGVSAELGFWESPVFATVRIEGTLTYSGRPDGYLPGTGQVDAAGILVQNQCDLTVYVRWATTTSASSVSAAPTCYYPARNVGSYVRRVTLQGQVSTYRTAGPPLSCYKGVTPCVSYAGTETVTITPEEGNLILTLNKTSASVGGGIYVTAKGVWAADGVTPVPFTVREWRWEGHGPELGGGHTKVCAAYYPGQCIVQVYQSGYVILEGVVNGKVKTGQVWLAVQGGDSLPPPPPDSLPGGGDGDSGDGDGAGGGCSDCCGDTTSNGLHLAACNPPGVDVQLLLTCTPTTLVRTDQVSCEVTGTPSVTFTLDSAQFIAGGIQLRDAGGYQVAAGASFKYVGPALLSTDVHVWGTLDSAGVPVARSATTSFSVTPRTWAELDALWPAPGIRRYTLDPPPVELDAAPRRVSPTRLALYPGLFVTVFPDWAGLIPQVLVASTGPNRGLTYLGKEVHFSGQPTIYTTPLFADPGFLGDQNGGMGGALPRCTLSQFRNAFEPEVERHEGMGQRSDSHWGVQSAELAKLGLNQRAEALVLLDPGNADPIDTLSTAYERWRIRTLLPLQAQFDAVDRPRVPQNAGCEIDLDRNDP